MASARLRMDAYLRASMANLIGPTPKIAPGKGVG